MWGAVTSGVLLACAFPFRIGAWQAPSLGWLAWIGLVPLLVSLHDARPRRACALGLVTGGLYHSVSLYWLYTAMHAYGGLAPWAAMLVLLLSVAILAAFVGASLGGWRWIATRWGRDPIWLLPAIWVAFDWLRNYFPVGGFSWSVLGQTQAAYLPLIQIADCTGVYGCTFAIVWVNGWGARVVGGWRARGDASRRRIAPATWATAGLVLVTLGYGSWRMATLRTAIRSWPRYRVGLVQPNIPQEAKWTSGLEARQLGALHDVMGDVVSNVLDLVIWPEASYPFAIPIAATAVPPRHVAPAGPHLLPSAPMLIGAVAAVDPHPAGRRHNSAFAVMPEGTIVARYDKQHLVPFGEYVPGGRWLRFARPLTAAVGDFVPGTAVRPVRIEGVAVGPLICYEDIFPEIARAHARAGAAFFADLTNDAWYGWSAAAAQHFDLSVFRAVEHRRTLVRATNTGISGIVDPLGRRVIASRLFEPAMLVGEVRLSRMRTIYTLLGDWLPAACAAVTLLLLTLTIVRPRRSAGREG